MACEARFGRDGAVDDLGDAKAGSGKQIPRCAVCIYILVTVIVSYTTRPKPDSELTGVVYAAH